MDVVDNFILRGLVNRGVELAVESFGVVFVAFKQICAESVISINIDIEGRLADHSLKTVAHILGASVGEGETEDVLRVSVSMFENIGNLRGKELSFASPGACQNQERSF